MDRNASTPLAGLIRQGVRAALGLAAGWLTKQIGAEDTATVIGAAEMVVFVGVQLALAPLGKWLRDKQSPLGKMF